MRPWDGGGGGAGLRGRPIPAGAGGGAHQRLPGAGHPVRRGGRGGGHVRVRAADEQLAGHAADRHVRVHPLPVPASHQPAGQRRAAGGGHSGLPCQRDVHGAASGGPPAPRDIRAAGHGAVHRLRRPAVPEHVPAGDQQPPPRAHGGAAGGPAAGNGAAGGPHDRGRGAD